MFIGIESDLNRKKKGYLTMKNLNSRKREFTLEKYNEFIKGNTRIDDFFE